MGKAEQMWNELRKMTNVGLQSACSNLGITPVSNRNDHLITALMDSGKDIAEIKAASVTPVAASNSKTTPAEILAAIDRAIAARVPAVPAGLDRKVDTLDNALAQVVAKINQQSTQLDGLGSHVSATEQNVKDAFKLVDDGICKVVDQMKKLDARVDDMGKPQDMSKQVTAAVAEAFKPIRDAFTAAKPEVQEKVITAIVPHERKKIRDVFALDHDVQLEGDDTCEVWGEPHAFDPDYIFTDELLLHALACVRDGDNMWMHGQRGTGKTQFAHNFAARLGRPFFQVSCHENLESADFIGADGLINGSTGWQDGIILKAYRTPGAVCLIDEATMVRASWTSELHRILEPRSTFSITRTGELVHRANGMVFMAADNTNGCGDESGRFAGTKMANSAYVDRFAYSLKVGFLPAATEIALLVKHGASKAHAKALINVFTRCRAEVGGSLVEPPSLRQAFAFCKAAKFTTPERAWENTVINKSVEASQEALRQLFTAHWSI